jgi:thiosulfate/3-mercaptopyruvate sulfurtransferase
MSRSGIARDTTVVLYGDKNNWWATYTFWVMKLFNHQHIRIMDGGRLKWEQEGRPLERETKKVAATDYPHAKRNDEHYRIFRDGVLRHQQSRLPLIDVRSPDEYSGKKLHMDGYPNEGALRGGHIPGAKNVPWARAVNPENGTFKDRAQLEQIYLSEQGLEKNSDVVTYCRIGERSSHSWFVLHYLLGFPNVKNYDGSWTEWGNLVGVPIEK